MQITQFIPYSILETPYSCLATVTIPQPVAYTQPNKLPRVADSTPKLLPHSQHPTQQKINLKLTPPILIPTPQRKHKESSEEE